MSQIVFRRLRHREWTDEECREKLQSRMGGVPVVRYMTLLNWGIPRYLIDAMDLHGTAQEVTQKIIDFCDGIPNEKSRDSGETLKVQLYIEAIQTNPRSKRKKK